MIGHETFLRLGKSHPFLRKTNAWVWGAVGLSALVCGMVAWVHMLEMRTIHLATTDLDHVRQARVDLAKGFLHVGLSQEPNSPFSEVEGLARLNQAVWAFEEAAARIDTLGHAHSLAFQQSVRAFQRQLELWRSQNTKGELRDEVALRVAFKNLERQADYLDQQTQLHVRDHSAWLDLLFKSTVTASVLLLSCVCGAILLVGSASKHFETVSQTMTERFRLAMEATNEGLWDLNVETGAVYYSPGYWRMLGYSENEREGVVGAWSDLLHPEDRERVLALNEACFSDQRDDLVTEFRLKTKTGAWRWILSRGKVVERNALSQAVRMVGTHVDITERKLVEEALRASEDQFRAIFQFVSVGIVQIDPADSRFIRFNDKYRDLTGYTEDELMAMTFITSLTHPDDRPRDNEIFRRAVTGKTATYTNEKRYIRKDGTVIWVRVNASFIRDANGRPIRSVGVCEDITARRLAEEEREKLQTQLLQAQKMESVGRLAGGIAHDFNNLLGVIIGHVDVLRDQMEAEHPFADDLSEIQSAAGRAANLTRQLLAFARKQTVSPKVLDLNETVGQTLKMLKRLIGEDIDLAWLPRKGLWPVKVDATQVDQILTNLCVNARDAIAGIGKVTIETYNVSADDAFARTHVGCIPGDYVTLAVSDNGCGMDAQTRALIFEPFFTTKETGHGTGLGLSTVYGIAKQNSGFVDVYSEPGNGSTFKIYFPRHAAEQALASEATPLPPAVKPKGQGEMILVVEDDPSLLKLTRIMLEREGYAVLCASRPEEAIRLAESCTGKIQLLITDVVMPDMNGRQIQARIREQCPSVKCLYMSGYTANAIAHHGVLDASVSFIQKPFTRKMLSEKVCDVLNEKTDLA